MPCETVPHMPRFALKWGASLMFRSCLNIKTIFFTVIFHWLVFQRDLSILYFGKKTPWEKNLGILAAVSCPWVSLKPQRVVTFL